MFSNILNLEEVSVLNKKQQGAVKGSGDTCRVIIDVYC